MKAKIRTNPGSQELTGVIASTEVYNNILLGKSDWEEHVKNRITAYTIPASVFERLLQLDREANAKAVAAGGDES